jgi:hypothetical protein
MSIDKYGGHPPVAAWTITPANKARPSTAQYMK